MFKVIKNLYNPLHGKSYEEVVAAVFKDPYKLVYIRNQTEELCEIAVRQCGLALRYIHVQTENICRLAVQQNGYALQYIHDQSEEICKLAVENDNIVLKLVDDKFIHLFE